MNNLAEKAGGAFVTTAWITDFVDAGWIDEVVATADTDLRAHRVALTHHYLSRMIDWWIAGCDSVWSRLDHQRSLAASPSNANWFTFATWATVTVNRDLSLRRTPAGTARLLPAPLRRSLTPVLLHLRASDGQRISRALSWAQRVVFVSTARIALAWLVSPDGGIDEATRTEVNNSVTAAASWPADNQPVIVSVNNGHLNGLWEAFGYYAEARAVHAGFEGDPAAWLGAKRGDNLRRSTPEVRTRVRDALVARYVLRANLLITAIEQDILDEAVGEVLDQVPELATRTLVRRAALWGDRYLKVPREITALQLPFQWRPATWRAAGMWARFLTDQVLVLALPSETLRLGRDVPPLDASQPFFPPDLYDLATLPLVGPVDTDDGQAVPKDVGMTTALCDFVGAFDRTRRDGLGSAARDWRRYDERMNWAATLLRSRQQDPTLYWCPYAQEDQARLRRGELPHGGGDPSDFEVTAPVTGLPTQYRI